MADTLGFASVGLSDFPHTQRASRIGVLASVAPARMLERLYAHQKGLSGGRGLPRVRGGGLAVCERLLPPPSGSCGFSNPDTRPRASGSDTTRRWRLVDSDCPQLLWRIFLNAFQARTRDTTAPTLIVVRAPPGRKPPQPWVQPMRRRDVHETYGTRYGRTADHQRANARPDSSARPREIPRTRGERRA